MELIAKLRASKLIRKGEFILKSGLKSDIYFDFKRLVSYPELFSDVCYELCKIIPYTDICLAGVPLGAIPYTVLISQILNLPMVLIREEAKNYGTRQQIEGDTFGKSVIVIEDVITTGYSVLKTLEVLKANNILVEKVVCILDRGGLQHVQDNGYCVESLYKMSDLAKEPTEIPRNLLEKKLVDLVVAKRSNMILDITRVCEPVNIIEFILKFHDKFCGIAINFAALDFSAMPKKVFMPWVANLKRANNLYVINYLTKVRDITELDDCIMLDTFNQNALLYSNINKKIILMHNYWKINNILDNSVKNLIVKIAKHKNIIGFVSTEIILHDYLSFSPMIMTQWLIENPDYKNEADIFLYSGIYEQDINDVEKIRQFLYDRLL